MALYSALHPVLEANQWFKNGSHPEDHVINNINSGRVVGRHPTYTESGPASSMHCPICSKASKDHGILKKLYGESDDVVCPGDYIQTFRDLKGRTLGYKLWKKKLFEQFFTLAEETPNV